MIQRYVFVKLKPEYATDAGRAEVRARTEQMAAAIALVRSWTIGLPADPGAAQAWDLVLTLGFDSRQDVNAFLHHPDHDAFYDGFLKERLVVIKGWNFTI